MDITEFRKDCLTMLSQAEGFSQTRAPGEAVARTRQVLRLIEARCATAEAVEQADLEHLRARALADAARYEVQRREWAAEIAARRERLDLREVEARQGPVR